MAWHEPPAHAAHDMLAGSAEPRAIELAVGWLQGTLLGTVATCIATVAVVAVGILMLSGRIDARRAIQVLLGCFIIFGASTIAAGINLAAHAGPGGGASSSTTLSQQLARTPHAYPAAPHDPYAN